MAKWSRRHTGVAWLLAASVLVICVLATWLFTKQVFEQRAITAAVESSLLQTGEALAIDKIALAQVALGEAQVYATQLQDASSPLYQRIDALSQELARYEKFTSYDRGGRRGWDAFPALEVYGVLDNPDWQQPLEEAGLPAEFIERLSDQAYAILVNLAWNRTLNYIPDAKERLAAIAESEAYLAKAITICPPSKGYYWALANCSQRMGDMTAGEVRAHHDAEALRLRELAKQTPPHNADELFYITKDRRWGSADVREREPFRWPYEDDREELLAAYRDVLRFEPGNAEAHFFTSHELDAEGRFAEAFAGWSAVLAIDPHDVTALARRGNDLRKLGRIEESVVDSQRAVDIAREAVGTRQSASDPRLLLASALRFLGECLSEAGDLDGSRKRCRSRSKSTTR